jgi:hypothetical protein
MEKLYRASSLVWSFFTLIGSGFAGGPDVNIALPWIEILGFLILGLINFKLISSIYGHVFLILLSFNIGFSIYGSLQSPYLKWDDISIRYSIPSLIILLCIVSIVVSKYKKR